MLIECLIVGFGGFIGSVLRYLISLIPLHETTTFPLNTFIVNILGAFFIGILAYYITRVYPLDERIVLFIKVGICGGFTTFSTFALETSDLIRNGDTLIAFVYVLLSVVVSVFVIFIPELLAR